MSPRAAPMAPEDRRRAILDVVVPLLVEHGSSVTTKQIAQAAGIAEGTIFRVFEDKDELFLAAAQAVLDPEVETAELAASTRDVGDLRSLIVAVSDHLLRRSQRVMAVMFVLRTGLTRQSHDKTHSRGKPMEFIIEANRALMSGLTELFEPHRDDLGVEPEVAATVLRTLVLGTRHPGAHSDYLLTPDEVADVMLHGVLARPTPREEKP